MDTKRMPLKKFGMKWRKGMYAFQKSHAVCYTWLAYQMAYLKINYLEDFRYVMEEYNTD